MIFIESSFSSGKIIEQIYFFIFFERPLRFFDADGQRALGKGLKVSE